MKLIELHESATDVMLKLESTIALRLNYENGNLPLTNPNRIDELKQTEYKLLVSYKRILMEILNN